ncbi:hypothetical protein BJ138DRAFT_1102754 [Hygrophoropsis aurantiaca]|uniref:Uncharacterized protein n=1 Tax=Hygrophoropsis aurantiaca TaxID=72124 RepID=A0ACB8A7T1_9AGAM|nr:hypothetical protein BJ138DRAFT_1102754 [Hygrophoropsis aurantiaca]
MGIMLIKCSLSGHCYHLAVTLHVKFAPTFAKDILLVRTAQSTFARLLSEKYTSHPRIPVLERRSISGELPAAQNDSKMAVFHLKKSIGLVLEHEAVISRFKATRRASNNAGFRDVSTQLQLNEGKRRYFEVERELQTVGMEYGGYRKRVSEAYHLMENKRKALDSHEHYLLSLAGKAGPEEINPSPTKRIQPPRRCVKKTHQLPTPNSSPLKKRNTARQLLLKIVGLFLNLFQLLVKSQSFLGEKLQLIALNLNQAAVILNLCTEYLRVKLHLLDFQFSRFSSLQVGFSRSDFG